MPFTAGQRRLLWFFRSLSIIVCLGLLFWPLLLRESVRHETPWVIVLNDASSSVLHGMSDTAQWPKRVQQWVDKLSQNHRVKVLSFGQEVQEGVQSSCSQNLTHFDPAFQYIQTHLAAQPIAAVVLLSDGIHNQGTPPSQAYASLAYPFYAVTLGDTSNYCDLRLVRAHKNAYAVLGNRFPVELDISASLAQGEHYELSIHSGQRLLHQQTVKIEHREDARRLALTLEAHQLGTLWYRAELKPLEGERIRSNNVLDFSVDVIDTKKKVLVLGAAAHPDLSAIHRALSDQAFNLEVQLWDRYKGQIPQHDAVILHHLPQNRAQLEMIERLLGARKPLGLFLSSACSSEALALLPTGLQIHISHPSDNDAQCVLNPNISAFTPDKIWADPIATWPPVKAPFGTYEVAKQAQIVAYQRVFGQTTSNPMMVLFENPDGVRCVNWVGDGFWRWRLEDYAQQQSHDRFDTWMFQTLNYLTQHSDTRRFLVWYETQIPQWQSIEMRAELYDESRQILREADIQLNIYDAHNALYPFRFVQDGLHYRVQIGSLAPGEYRFEAVAHIGQNPQRFNGSFRVFEEQPEQRDLRARFQEMATMSQTYGGIVVGPDQMEQIITHLDNRNDIKSVRHVEYRYVGLIDWVWILVVLVLLLSAEWFLRRYWGYY